MDASKFLAEHLTPRDCVFVRTPYYDGGVGSVVLTLLRQHEQFQVGDPPLVRLENSTVIEFGKSSATWQPRSVTSSDSDAKRIPPQIYLSVERGTLIRLIDQLIHERRVKVLR